MGFPTTPKSAPKLDPFPPFWGSKTWKNAKNGFYHFQMIKLCGEVFPIENLQRQSCLHICLEDISEKFPKSVHNYTFYTDFSEPLDWRKCANFKRLYFLNGCIDLDVRYTAGKDMTRSTSWWIFIGKVYHLLGQNIGQTSENSVFGLYFACNAAVSCIFDAWSRLPPASAELCHL